MYASRAFTLGYDNAIIIGMIRTKSAGHAVSTFAAATVTFVAFALADAVKDSMCSPESRNMRLEGRLVKPLEGAPVAELPFRQGETRIFRKPSESTPPVCRLSLVRGKTDSGQR